MIHHIIGSALEPIKKPALICHIVNDIGRWGSGFVIAVSNVDSAPEDAYKNWYKHRRFNGSETLPLGEIQVVPVDNVNSILVVNMVAQHDIRTIDGTPPIRYPALEECLIKVNTLAVTMGATLHMPRIGAVRSGGDWAKIEKIIERQAKVENYIYTLDIEKDMWDSPYENSTT